MLKGCGSKQPVISTGEISLSGSPNNSSGSPGSPGSPYCETMRPRKKLSFKEPEIFGYCMKLRKPGYKPKPIPEFSLDENPLEEENFEFEELEVYLSHIISILCCSGITSKKNCKLLQL